MIITELVVNPLVHRRIQHHKRLKFKCLCNLFFRQFIQFVKNTCFITLPESLVYAWQLWGYVHLQGVNSFPLRVEISYSGHLTLQDTSPEPVNWDFFQKISRGKLLRKPWNFYVVICWKLTDKNGKKLFSFPILFKESKFSLEDLHQHLFHVTACANYIVN